MEFIVWGLLLRSLLLKDIQRGWGGGCGVNRANYKENNKEHSPEPPQSMARRLCVYSRITSSGVRQS